MRNTNAIWLEQLKNCMKRGQRMLPRLRREMETYIAQGRHAYRDEDVEHFMKIEADMLNHPPRPMPDKEFME